MRNTSDLDYSTQLIADSLRRLSTEKLCGVLAFCEDGKMDMFNACCCHVGVLSSANLHVECFESHYTAAKCEKPEMLEEEYAYMLLGWGELDGFSVQARIDSRYLELLRAELASREEAAPEPVEQTEAVHA